MSCVFKMIVFTNFKRILCSFINLLQTTKGIFSASSQAIRCSWRHRAVFARASQYDGPNQGVAKEVNCVFFRFLFNFIFKNRFQARPNPRQAWSIRQIAEGPFKHDRLAIIPTGNAGRNFFFLGKNIGKFLFRKKKKETSTHFSTQSLNL